MKIEEFWNQAFLAALARLPAEAAKKEADEATQICLHHWIDHRLHWAPIQSILWQEQDITNAPQQRMPGPYPIAPQDHDAGG
ncbi:hypothetical protein [Lysobacter sp. Root690]|uniref:hypothetical protein n=1 Tax=Lysobacter sp. Root690 TaxID=1736588 RepID=UPI0006F5745B|nr:hypothetical protein [Lysobacter sp. Root690]KRB10271.1 hypothetical protein ASD86_25070 [Lysobacter sp. Root690]